MYYAKYENEEKIFCTYIFYCLVHIFLCVSAAFAQQRSATVIKVKHTPLLPALSSNGLSHFKEVHTWFEILSRRACVTTNSSFISAGHLIQFMEVLERHQTKMIQSKIKLCVCP